MHYDGYCNCNGTASARHWPAPLLRLKIPGGGVGLHTVRCNVDDATRTASNTCTVGEYVQTPCTMTDTATATDTASARHWPAPLLRLKIPGGGVGLHTVPWRL